MNTFMHILFLMIGLIGCDRDDQIRVYSAPKEAPPDVAQVSQTTLPSPADAPITWTIPPGWVQDPPRQMRVASFRTSNEPVAAEVVVSRFAAGNFGSILDNLNRWRNMVGLEPVDDAATHKPEKATVAGKDAEIYDIAGKEKRLRVVMVPAGEQVWFFRLVGTTEAVGHELQSFNAFLQSVQFK